MWGQGRKAGQRWACFYVIEPWSFLRVLLSLSIHTAWLIFLSCSLKQSSWSCRTFYLFLWSISSMRAATIPVSFFIDSHWPMDDRVVVYEREGERETEAETEIGKQKGRTIRKREESPGAFQRGVGMRQGSHRQTCLPILVPCGSSRKSKKLRRGSPGSSARENQAASLIWIRMYREYVLISLWMHNHIHVIVRIYVKHWIMFMTYAHNYTTVKVVTIWVHMLVTVLSSLGLCPHQYFFLECSSPVTSPPTPASPLLALLILRSQFILHRLLKVPHICIWVAWHVPRHLCHLRALPGYFLFSLERPWVPQGLKTMLYLSLYPQCLVHSGCSNILAELGNKILELLFCFLKDSLYPP